jgi:hypothetical protein
MHQIIIEAVPVGEHAAGLIVRCSCGEFLLDRDSGVLTRAEVSLPELTPLIGAHYIEVTHPEKLNGKGKK